MPITDLSPRKILEFFRRLRRKRGMNERSDLSSKVNQVAPSNGHKNAEPISIHSPSTTPRFPRVDLDNGRSPSIYENVNFCYDSAYDSEDQDEDASIRNRKKSGNEQILHNNMCQCKETPWMQMGLAEKENFDNAWNQTIESIVNLSHRHHIAS